jgi:hypothetical protein
MLNMIFIHLQDKAFSRSQALILKLKDFAYVVFINRPNIDYDQCKTFAIQMKVQ